jgi:hypothetical protein
MSLTTATAPTVTAPRYATTRPAMSLRRTTIVAGLVAAAVTTCIAAAVHAAGVSLAVGGKMIPLAAFAQLTFLGAVIGGVLVAVHVLAAATVVAALVRHAHDLPPA